MRLTGDDWAPSRKSQTGFVSSGESDGQFVAISVRSFDIVLEHCKDLS